MRLRRHSLLARLVAYFLLLSLAPLIVVGGVSYWRAIRDLQQETFNRLITTVVLKEDAINRWIIDMKQGTRVLAQTPIVRQHAALLLTREETDPQFLSAYRTLQDYFATILAEKPDFLEIFLLTDVGGKVVLSTNREHEGEYKVTDTYFVRGREETYVQNVYPSVSLGKPAMTIATPLFDDTGSRIGVLAVHLNLDVMDEILLERTGLGATGETYLVNKFNVFVSEARFGPERFPRGVHTEGIDAALEGLDGTGLYENYRGVPVVGAYRWMEERELALLAEVEQEEALAPARGLTRIVLLIGLIVAGSVAVAAYGTARQISAPIIALTETATRITAGDLAQVAAVPTRDEIGVLATAFNSMTAQLRGLIASLEQQVADRTRELERRALQLQAAAEVARDATAIRDVDQLLDETVHLISERFGFYHAGVFLVDDAREYAVLRAASSEGGQRMLQRGHKLAVGKVGIVGYVAGTGEPRVALDVGKDAVFFDNPDLPETHSEMALPLKVRGQTIGVLDVQSTEEAAFTKEDVAVLQTMADQLAVAIENARLFRETQERLRELSRLYGEYSATAWAQLAPPERPLGYVYDRVDIAPVEKLPTPTLDLVQQRGESVALVEPEAGQATLAMPLKLRDQIIGALGIQETDEAREWSPDEIALVEAVSSEVALALENARLFEEAQAERARLATLYEVSRLLAGAPTLEEVTQAALQVAPYVGAQHGDLILLDVGGQPFVRSTVPERVRLTPEQTQEYARRVTTSGLQSWVLANRQSALVLETKEDPRWLVLPGHEVRDPVRSAICIPLFDRHGEIMGTLSYTHPRPRAFGPEEQRLAEEIAARVAVALENAHLFERTQAALAETEALYRVGQAISQLGSLDETFQTLAEVLVEQLGYTNSWLALVDKQAQTLRGIAGAGAGVTDEIVAVQVPLDPQARNPAVQVVLHREPIVINNVSTDERAADLDEEIRAILGRLVEIPILVEDEAAGVIAVNRPLTTPELTDRDVEMLLAVADQAAVALENARLLEETERRAAQLAAAAEVARDATAILDVDQLLDETVHLISEQFGFYHAGVFLVDEPGEYAVLHAASSAGGQRMLERGHKLAVGKVGIVGYVAGTGEPRVALDVGEDAVFFDNPDLPETRSEMALPLISRGRVIGVLDVQSTETAAFSEEDVTTLQTMADQLAIAIENARLYQEAVHTAERLTEVDRLKSQFLANMSHELRTPLNSIIGFSRVILKGIDGPLTDMQRTDLQAIYESGQHLLGLINDILDLSKIEAGKMELTFESVDLREIIKGVMSTAIALVKDKPIELQQSIAPRLPTVYGDARRIRQVLLNLLSNAAKFTEEGFIRVTAEATPPLEGERGWVVTISVADSGIGIPPEKMRTIFEPFTQVDASTTRRAGGTGLGLSISKHFVELHGGRMWAESTPGEGSTFWFTLPIEPISPPLVGEGPGEGLEQPEPKPGRKLLLCVDDDEGVITLFRRYLGKQGYQVIGLTDSTLVVEKARQLQPFAITLDVLMPRKDGWQVIEELKTDPDTRRIPVIMCTILSERERGLSLGATDYLVKPIIEQDLLAALERLDREAGYHRVLVVDDQPEDRNLLRRMIESQEGYEVVEAAGGQEAIALVRQARPHIIILDLLMPEVDGFAVLEVVKADETTRSIPIIVVTAKDLSQEERDFLNSRVEALLRKGLFEQQELLADVAAALERLAVGRQPSAVSD